MSLASLIRATVLKSKLNSYSSAEVYIGPTSFQKFPKNEL